MHSFLYNMILYYGIIEFQGQQQFYHVLQFYRLSLLYGISSLDLSPVAFFKGGDYDKPSGRMGGARRYKILRPKSNLVIGCHTHSFKRNMPKLRCERLGSCYSRAQTPSPSQDFPARRARRVGRKTPGVSRSIFGPFWSHVRPGRARLVSYSTKPGKLWITILMVQIIWAPRNQRN